MDYLSEELQKCRKLFENWPRTHPNGPFSQFQMQWVVSPLTKEFALARLGLNQIQGKSRWKDAKLPSQSPLSIYPKSKNKRLAPKTMKFCGYGCSNFRGNLHLVKGQASESVVTLDITRDLIQSGKKMVGDLVEAKQPSEAAQNCLNMKRVLHQKGAEAAMQMLLFPKLNGFQRSPWARSKNFDIEALKPVHEKIGEDIRIDPFVDSNSNLWAQKIRTPRFTISIQ